MKTLHVEDIIAAAKEFVAAQIVQYQNASKENEELPVQALYLNDASAALDVAAKLQAHAKRYSRTNMIAHSAVMIELYKMDTAPREYFMEMIENKIKERGRAVSA